MICWNGAGSRAGERHRKKAKPLTTSWERAVRNGDHLSANWLCWKRSYIQRASPSSAPRAARKRSVTRCWPTWSTAASRGRSAGQPRGNEILGLKCNKSLDEYQGQIDFSVIVVGKYVKDALRSSIETGAKSVIVITAGFKEVGAAGAAAEQELVEICRSAGVRKLGPNCLGVINTDHSHERLVREAHAGAWQHFGRVAIGRVMHGDPGLGVEKSWASPR